MNASALQAQTLEDVRHLPLVCAGVTNEFAITSHNPRRMTLPPPINLLTPQTAQITPLIPPLEFSRLLFVPHTISKVIVILSLYIHFTLNGGPVNGTVQQPPQNVEHLQPPGPSQESRASLPEEAKCYIATIGESLAPSPLANSFQPKPTDIRSGSPSRVSTSEVKDDQIQANRVKEDIFDLDDNTGDHITGSTGSPPNKELEEDRPSSQSMEDFTMPQASHLPVTPNFYPLSDVQDQASIHPRYTTSTMSMKADPTMNAASFQSSSSSNNNSQPRLHHKQSQSQPQFQQLPSLCYYPLVARVRVSHSSVRPSGQGKVVPSCVITVDPRPMQEPWKIEKLYSDLVLLDQKVRSASQNLSKKVPALPDHKLWSNYAPVKVDQWKVDLNFSVKSPRTHVFLFTLTHKGCTGRVS